VLLLLDLPRALSLFYPPPPLASLFLSFFLSLFLYACEEAHGMVADRLSGEMPALLLLLMLMLAIHLV
jgi:hypothetical protein